jgi:hypothetical protein
MEETRGVDRVLVGKSEGKRPLGTTRRRRVDTIEDGSSGSWMWSMDWIELAQDKDKWRAVVNAAMNLRVP